MIKFGQVEKAIRPFYAGTYDFGQKVLFISSWIWWVIKMSPYPYCKTKISPSLSVIHQSAAVITYLWFIPKFIRGIIINGLTEWYVTGNFHENGTESPIKGTRKWYFGNRVTGCYSRSRSTFLCFLALLSVSQIFSLASAFLLNQYRVENQRTLSCIHLC